jgi:hypothetical protein
MTINIPTKEELDIRSKALRDETREKAITPTQAGSLFEDLNKAKVHQDEVPNFIAGTDITGKLEALGGEQQLNINQTRGGIAFDLVEDFILDGFIVEKGINIPVLRINQLGVALAPESNDSDAFEI